MTEFITDSTKLLKVQEQKVKDGTLYSCTDRVEKNPDDAGYFIPILIGDLKKQDDVVFYTKGRCFSDITFRLHYNGLNSDGTSFETATLTVDTANPASLLCKDWFFFSTSTKQHVEVFFFEGHHEITFDGLTDDDKIEILFNGIDAYMFCDGFIDTFISAFKFLTCFLGGFSPNPNIPIFGSHIPQYQADANVAFIKAAMGITLEKRETNYVDIPEESIHSGDFFAIDRLDGLDQII